jgi:hypothetical protein
VRAVIRENRHLTVCDVSEEAGIAKRSCHTILTEKLEMHRVAAKFMPCLLTDEKKANRVSQELFDRSIADENFPKNFIISDGTRVYGYDIETKAQSSQLVGKSSPRPKKAHQSRPNVKVLFIFFFYWEGVVHHEFVPHGQSMDSFTWRS